MSTSEIRKYLNLFESADIPLPAQKVYDLKTQVKMIIEDPRLIEQISNPHPLVIQLARQFEFDGSDDLNEYDVNTQIEMIEQDINNISKIANLDIWAFHILGQEIIDSKMSKIYYNFIDNGVFDGTGLEKLNDFIKNKFVPAVNHFTGTDCNMAQTIVDEVQKHVDQMITGIKRKQQGDS